MATTHIQTETLPRTRVDGAGEFAEILNRELCGAENVAGALRWLDAGDRFTPDARKDAHQLLYLMGGEGTITLNGADYDVTKGAGIYLGPSETAAIRHRGSERLKLFHLIVPIREELQLSA